MRSSLQSKAPIQFGAYKPDAKPLSQVLNSLAIPGTPPDPETSQKGDPLRCP